MIKSEAFSFLLVAGERATFLFWWNPATVARMFGGFASSREAKSASRSEAPSTSHSERATFAFYRIQLQWLESVGHFTPSNEAKSASLLGVPMSKDSKRATFAFY